ncbi:MAG: metal-dependent phosphohydrolase [Desulfobacterales bacterium]|nr:MAG: metal-dependent phosphohydrolase [Desulfobacterales bacterium]
MTGIADLLFEARQLKELPRSGYTFLGAGKESVAEHSFLVTFIAMVMAELTPEADALRLIRMCLVHDLPEARTGDMNYVQREYVTVDEDRAVADLAESLPFGRMFAPLLDEFNGADTLEARLARDADQLSFLLDLKALSDIGYRPPEKWIPQITGRLLTPLGRQMAGEILATEQDSWWLKKILTQKQKI